MVPSLLGMAGSALKQVTERIPMSGFKLLDRLVIGLSKATSEVLPRPSDSVAFVPGAKFSTAEDVPTPSDSLALGTAMFQSQDLQSPLSESVSFTNM